MKDDVVIAGISGRFPECDNLEEFWEKLVNGIDMITENDRRWPAGSYGLPERKGTLKADLEKFDAGFFNINLKQAEKFDPQVSQLLEVTFEAILDAGINPTTIRGSNIGVYTGCSSHDSIECLRSSPDSMSAYDVLGGSACMLSNRISYCLDLKGPSFTLDTYCSSSLIALHNGVTAIRNGECEAAIVCGVNLTLNPFNSMQIKHVGVLSSDGKCKSFDASGDGYVRSEAVVAVFLQKKINARRNYATIVHSKTSADGYKIIGISNPSGVAQEKLMRETYKEAGMDPNKVVYVEAHGTGTAVGDPQELNAIANIFTLNRTEPLLIGSVKSCMGHSEGGSSLCALAKLVLSMEKGLLPPNLHFSQPNPSVRGLLNGILKVVTECTMITGSLFSLNASGIGGSNAHIILKSNSEVNHEKVCLDQSSLPILIPFSGRTKEAVQFALERILIEKNSSMNGLLQKIHEHPIPGYDFRGTATYDDFQKQTIAEVKFIDSTPRPLWFIFPGMGSQWIGMAEQMMEFPSFKKSIETSAEILKEYDLNLIDILINKSDDMFIEFIGVSFISVAIALVDLISSIGLKPDGIIGHSAGELVCAYADGSLTQKEALLINMYKDESTKLCSGGSMAAVGLTWEEAKIKCPPEVYPVCHNGSNNVTVAGLAERIKDFVKELHTKDIFAREIDSGGVAFHSPNIAHVVPALHAKLKGILTNPKKRSKEWISTSLEEIRWNETIAETTSADYIINNITSPVHFYEALKYIPSNAVVVEISAHAIFQSILKKDLPKSCAILGLMKKNAEDNTFRFISGVGTLFQLGFNPLISNLYPEMIFPVRSGTTMIAPLVKWNHEESFTLPDFTHKNSSGNSVQIVEISIASAEYKFLEGHMIDNLILFPASGYLVLCWKALAKLNGVDFQNLPVRFENVKFERATILPNIETKVKLKINILEFTGQFEISERASVIATGSIFKAEDFSILKLCQYKSEITNSKQLVSLKQGDIYKWFGLRGYRYDGLFRGIVSAEMDGNFCKLLWLNNWIAFLDTLLQTSLFSTDTSSLYLPTGLNKLTIDPNVLKKYIENNKSSELPVISSTTQKTISGPGIEFQGLKFTQSTRREKVQPAPTLEEYRFVPYMDSQEIVWEFPTALKICLDIILENSSSNPLAICEFSEGNDSIGHKLQILNNHPGRKINVELLSETVFDLPPFTNRNKDVQEKVYDCLIIRENLNFVSKYGFLVQPGGFILFVTPNLNPVGLIQEIMNSCWIPIPVVYKNTRDYQFFMIKKNRSPSEKQISVEVDLSYNWFTTVKNALSNSEKSSPQFVLHSSLQNCGIIGLVNCLRKEPRGKNIHCTFSTENALIQNIPENDLTFNVINGNGEFGSYRHLLIPDIENTLVRSKNVCLKLMTKGNMSTLYWIEVPFMEKQSTVYDVYYAPLNFRDVVVASGQLSPEALPSNIREEGNVLGTEFVGKNSHGHRVMGIVPCKAFATQICTNKGLIWPIPTFWTMEEAATVPVAYATAYYALVIRGQLQLKESILIHSGAGAVGQAAIAVALSKQCQIYITVGSDEKRASLMTIFPKLKETNFASSRNTDFKQHILQETHGLGVNLVLNSLEGEKLQASVELLANGGRFLEIGKLDLVRDSRLGMSIFLKNITFHGILLDNYLFQEKSEKTFNQLLRLVEEGIESGVVQPMKRTVYSYNQAEHAFRSMATGKHIGKIILKIRDEQDSPSIIDSVIPLTYFNPNNIYIIVGGLGGIGLEMVDWFISRGAKKLALVSRSGIVNGFQLIKTSKWIQAGINVMIARQDTSTLAGVKELFQECLKEGPIGGIFNLAMVLRDGIFTNQTVENFEVVLKPKLTITINLDMVSRELCGEDLEYFVVFSSVSCGRGNAGQSNYGMANSSMERICENRKKDGFTALAIQWGAIAEAGIVHEMMKGKDGLIGGTVPQSLSSLFSVLDKYLCFQQNIRSAVVSSLVLPEHTNPYNDEEMLASNKKIPLSNSIARILGLKDTNKISKLSTLGDLGVDSLVSVEVQRLIEGHSNISFTTNEIRLLTWEKLKLIEQGNS